ncbi:MAG: glycine cleavage system protein T [Phycisphaerae bacterium SM23_30]|nr:MAG: glycine cleavage system protein T [Phycisphaerae bacterium SM23_30]
MEHYKQTVFHDRHVELGAKMVEFVGWHMPIQYPAGIVQEHLATRNKAGLFDVSHMGRFVFRGEEALAFLQYVLSNNSAGLEEGECQYAIIPNERGGAVDDSYLYRFYKDEYLLVVNGANRQKDWDHFQAVLPRFKQVEMTDKTEELTMVSLQGPESKEILLGVIEEGELPEPMRNELSIVKIKGAEILLARTGYTGEPICFELFIERKDAVGIWDLLLEKGAQPIGLGARDTLRLEAALPLYGHEFGEDPGGEEMPIMSCPLARFAVSFSPLKGDYIGREPLFKQFEALKLILNRDYSRREDLPRLTMPLALTGRGVARAGDKVYRDGRLVGYIASGTMVPHWQKEGEGLFEHFIDEKGMRAICLAYVDCDLLEDDLVEVEIRGKRTSGVIVPYHMRSEAPPYARPIGYDQLHPEEEAIPDDQARKKVLTLLNKARENTIWRQRECINLIPSEMTPSAMTRLLSIMDPADRYAEHKQMKAFCDAEVFYYQGTDFIGEVERLLVNELCKYLGCTEVETRVVSGQMANTGVFSALVDYLNRTDRKSEQRRIRHVMNHHIIKGGHLSAQPMGALRDFVARDPKTEKPAVVNFPVRADNPYKVDVEACREIIEEFKPELIILGKSMIIHKEPVAEMRALIDEIYPDCVLMYDMAHVLGLVGPYFQEPFKEGADIVTGSTHKTFFGPQRGVIACNYKEQDLEYELWEAIQRRAFPGSVSNHHLGTLVGLLLASYEMNCFKAEYQKQVVANAKAFARALKECGLEVAGDPAISYTETHQVIINVGYARGTEAARRLEKNNIIVNYQASPVEEGFTAAGSLRTGVSEMTRFGMKEKDFKQVAQLIRDVIDGKKGVKEEVTAFRKRFLELKYCFSEKEFDEAVQKLHELV